jgi:hypothetical protein
LKIFDDDKRADEIVADRNKMRKLTSLCPIETDLGVLVSDVQNGLYTDRIRTLEEALGHGLDVTGSAQLSVSGGWRWCFVSGRTDAPVTVG